MLLLPTTCYNRPSSPPRASTGIVPPFQHTDGCCYTPPDDVCLTKSMFYWTGRTKENDRERSSVAWVLTVIDWRCCCRTTTDTVWVTLIRLVRNRGCFKRTSDEDVVKRPAAGCSSILIHFLSRSCRVAQLLWISFLASFVCVSVNSTISWLLSCAFIILSE